MSASSILSRLRHKGQITEEEYRKLMEIKNMAKRMTEQGPTDDATLKDIFCTGCEYKEQEPCITETEMDEYIKNENPKLILSSVDEDEYKDVLKEPCNDAISKNNVITTICQYGTTKERTGQYMITASEMKQDLVDLIDSLPSVQPSRKGHWIREVDFENIPYYVCSECGVESVADTNFCFECGADMRGTK